MNGKRIAVFILTFSIALSPIWLTYFLKHYTNVSGWIVSREINYLLNQNKKYIDELLLLYQNTKEENFDRFTYCLDILAEYRVMLNNCKDLVAQKPELKESISRELERALDVLLINSDKDDNDTKSNIKASLVDAFEEHLSELRS